MNKNKVPIHESTYICSTLAMISGFLEAYTFLLKGGVFANAQTGNFAFMGMAIAKGEFLKALTYLIPMCFYVLGIALTVTMPRFLDSKGLVKWDTVFVFAEMIILAAIGFVPATAPKTISTVLISFICAMQYNTFKRTNGMNFSSTFCTNNLRQAAINMIDYAKSHQKQSLHNSLNYLLINGVFLFGAVIGTFCVKFFGEHAVWICSGVLVPVFFALIFGRREMELELSSEK